jgi:hypothetical protein
MNKSIEYTVYGLIHPQTLTLFYVGITTKHVNQRFDGHLSDAKKPQKWATTARPIVSELLDAGYEPISVTLDRIKVSDVRFGVELERLWINHTWSAGHPIQNTRNNYRDDRPIYLANIKRLHQALDDGLTYEDYQALEYQFAASLLTFFRMP